LLYVVKLTNQRPVLHYEANGYNMYLQTSSSSQITLISIKDSGKFWQYVGYEVEYVLSSEKFLRHHVSSILTVFGCTSIRAEYVRSVD